MCTITTPSVIWHHYDAELEELKRQLRQAQIEEEKARIRRELARMHRYPRPTLPPDWLISHFPNLSARHTPVSIEDVLRKIPAR